MAATWTAPLCIFLGCFTAFSGALVTTSCNIFQKDLQGSDEDLHVSCPGLSTVDSGLLVRCSNVNHLEIILKEVPQNVETLCFSGLLVKNISEGIFSGLGNLRALYLQGNFFVLGGAFRGLVSLRYLVMKGGLEDKEIMLDDGVFQGLETLTHLELENIFIDIILQPNIFKPLKALQSASFSQNEVHRLSFLTNTLASLATLEILKVKRNGIIATRELDCIETGTSSQTIGFSPNISTLDLSSNELKKVEDSSLCNFKNLKVFKADATFLKVKELLQSGIEEAEALSLNAMKNNDYMSLMNVCKVVAHLKVRNLTVAQNFIGHLDPESLEGCSDLLSLNLSGNLLRSFSSHLVQKLPSIMFLLLSDNKIKTLDLCRSESGSILLRKLTHLDLSLNRITDLGIQQLSCLPALVSLDLSSNHIVDLKNGAFLGMNRLETLNLESNGLFLLENFYFEHLPILKVLDLKGNKLKNHNNSFHVLTQLEELSLSFEMLGIFQAPHPHLTKLQVESSEIEIGCLQNCSTMEKVEVKASRVYISTCKPSPFRSVKVLHLEGNNGVICYPIGLPDSYSVGIRSFPNVERVYYSSSADIPLINVPSPLKDTLPFLSNLRHLHLKNLRKEFEEGFLVPHQLFHNLTSLWSLILEDSGIEHFSASMFTDLTSLELLVIKSQEVKTLQEGLFSGMDRLKYLYLIDIHLECSCDQAWIGGWLVTHTKVISPKMGAIKCSLGPLKENWLNFLEKQCSSQYEYSLFIGTCSFQTVFIMAALLYHKTRWYLLYLLHILRTWWNYRGRRDGYRRYDFDVFVSYSSYDEHWVVKEFLPNLEEQGPPFFKVCLHGRDFEPGKDILDNIVDSIYQSRRTICLVSHNYLHSHWCSMEMRMATYRLIVERENMLIVVFLEKISMEKLSHYHQMARLVKKKTYLEWTEDAQEQILFWARLRKTIGENEEETQEVVDG